MSDDQFTKLFKYMEEFRTDVNKRFDEHDRRFNDVTGAIAELSAQVRDYHNETILLSHQVDKLREAIKTNRRRNRRQTQSRTVASLASPF